MSGQIAFEFFNPVNWSGGGDPAYGEVGRDRFAAWATVNPPHPMMEVITHIGLCGEPYVFSIQNYIRFDLLSFNSGISVASNAHNHSVHDTAFPLTAQQH